MPTWSRIVGTVVVVAATALLTTAVNAAGVGGTSTAQRADTAALAALAPPVYQPDAQAQYVSITPCRIVDTRVAGGKLGNLTQRTYVVGGTSGFPAQGGTSGGCGIPVGATGIAATLIANTPDRGGYLRAWPAGITEPNATVLTYLAGPGNSTGATLSITPGTAASLTVRNHTGTIDLVIDVTGYYVKPLAAFISSSGQPYSGSSRILAASHIGTGVYEVQFDRSIRYCTAAVTAYVSSYFASASTWYDSSRPDTVRVWLWTAAGAAVDQYFYITVSC